MTSVLPGPPWLLLFLPIHCVLIAVSQRCFGKQSVQNSTAPVAEVLCCVWYASQPGEVLSTGMHGLVRQRRVL